MRDRKIEQGRNYKSSRADMGKKIKIFPLISKKKIEKKVKELAKKISRNYKNKKLHLIIVLRGAFIFGADLVRFLKMPVKILFLKTESYKGKRSTGKVKIEFLDPLEIKGKYVLIVEDIIDTSLTIQKIVNYLKKFNPKSLKVCSLLEKEKPRKKKIKIDYLGFKIPDKFVVGYGLDCGEKFRNLSYIGYIK